MLLLLCWEILIVLRSIRRRQKCNANRKREPNDGPCDHRPFSWRACAVGAEYKNPPTALMLPTKEKQFTRSPRFERMPADHVASAGIRVHPRPTTLQPGFTSASDESATFRSVPLTSRCTSRGHRRATALIDSSVTLPAVWLTSRCVSCLHS